MISHLVAVVMYFFLLLLFYQAPILDTSKSLSQKFWVIWMDRFSPFNYHKKLLFSTHLPPDPALCMMTLGTEKC